MEKYRLRDAPCRITADDGTTVTLYQIVAVRDFADVTCGSAGGWVSDTACLSQHGDCWIYDENSRVYGGATISGNSRLTGTCTISHQAIIEGNAWIDNASISQQARISDNVTVQASQVRGECHLRNDARVLNGSLIVAAKGLTPDHDTLLQIYDRATVSASRVVHQAQIYGDAIVDRAFIEHRAEVFDSALLQGNEDNNVWVCDCAKVYGSARVVAGHGPDDIPTLRYRAQVAENAVVEGNCVLKHHVLVGGYAWLQGGPLLLDDHVLVTGHARLRGDVVIEERVEIGGNATIESWDGEAIHIRGPRVINGDERITRTPLLGSL